MFTQVSETVAGLRVSATSVGLKWTFFRSDWDLLKASFLKVLFLMRSSKRCFYWVHHTLQCLSYQIWTQIHSWTKVAALSALHRAKKLWFITARPLRAGLSVRRYRVPFWMWSQVHHLIGISVSPFPTEVNQLLYLMKGNHIYKTHKAY